MNMYLNKSLKDYENLHVHTYKIPEEFIQAYNLQQFVTPPDGFSSKYERGCTVSPKSESSPPQN